MRSRLLKDILWRWCFNSGRTHICSTSAISQLKTTAFCQRSFSFAIDQNALLSYSSYLLKLFKNETTLKRIKSFPDGDFPKLLFDELGGKPRLVIDSLRDLSQIARSLEQAHHQLKELSNLAESSYDESDFLREIETEMMTVEEEIKTLKNNFVDALVSDKELDHCEGAVLEVSAGVGGQEAMLFAKELYEMYRRFCYQHGFDLKEVTSECENNGGLLQASCIITSPDGVAYRYLKHEAGIHRVQRVPKTENRGRLHTSAASVAVIPKQDISSFSLNPNEIKKHFTTSPGGGGQHVNKTMSCVLVRHEPTGIQVRCHATRIQVENLNRAMEQLRQILYKRFLDEKSTKTNTIRQQQTKSRDRSDKIRTYNFPNDRIVDHRIGYTVYGIEDVLSGGSAFVSMLHVLQEKFSQDDKIAVINALIREAGIL